MKLNENEKILIKITLFFTHSSMVLEILIEITRLITS
jgi:hypothetical protein